MIAARRCLVTKRFKYDLSAFFFFLFKCATERVSKSLLKDILFACSSTGVIVRNCPDFFESIIAGTFDCFELSFGSGWRSDLLSSSLFIWYLANRSLQRLSSICIFFKRPSFEIFFLFKFLPFSSCSAIFNCILTIYNSC